MRADLDIESATAVLKRGGVIAYPTEAVWGLGCDPFNQSAVQTLLAIKQRPVEKGLILIAATLEQLRPLVDFASLSTDQTAAVLASWPGPHTWIVPASATAPRWITGSHDSLAVRVSAHPQVMALCLAHAGALVSTSANLAGEPPVAAREALDPAMLAQLDGVLGGHTGGLARPTPIRDARSGNILRD